MSKTSPYFVGQTVRIHETNRRQLGSPVEGREGTITKIGRTLGTVEWMNHYVGGRTVTNSFQFRLEDGCKNDQWGHTYIKTEEQTADDLRRSVALGILAQADIRVGGRKPTAMLEALAHVVADFAVADLIAPSVES